MANVGLYFIYFLFLSNFWGAVHHIGARANVGLSTKEPHEAVLGWLTANKFDLQ